jgi:hypothetical protein
MTYPRAASEVPDFRMTDEGDIGPSARLVRVALALLPIVCTAIVYRPIIRAYFITDDFYNLFLIINRDPIDFILRPHGGHLLATRNSLFYIFYQLFGMNSAAYFWVVLFTHLANVALLFQVIRHFTSSRWLACFGATLWGTAPVHAGTLDWYSVYGHVIVATITLYLLLRIGQAVDGERPLPRSAVYLWPLLLLTASTSFGVGIGVTLVFPIAVLCFLPPSRQRTRLLVTLFLTAVAVPLIYRGLVRLYVWYAGPSPEAFGVDLLVAGLQYWPRILAMCGFLLSYGITSLALGFSFVQGAFPGIAPYLVSAVFLVALVAAFRQSPSPVRRQLLGCLVLAIGAYGMIAAGRAVFFDMSTIGYAVVQPRYHYLGTIPFAIILCVLLNRFADRVHLPAPAAPVLFVAWLGWQLIAYDRAAAFIDLHAPQRAETEKIVRTVRAQIDATPPGGEVRIPNKRVASIGALIDLAAFPGWAAMFTLFFPANVVDGKPVYFLVPEPDVIEANRDGRRTAGLLIPTETGEQLAPAPRPQPKPSDE